MSTFTMLIGLPGSGKSYYAEKYYTNKSNCIIHSSDSIREELGDINDQSKNNEIFRILHKRVKQDLRDGKDVVYDATNINFKKRLNFLNSLKGIDCYKVAIVICTPFQECLNNNANRDRKVPNEVIDNMYRHFDIPWYNEGWDKIELAYMKPSYTNYYGFYGVFHYDYMNFDQQNPHHTMSLGNHCLTTHSLLKNNYTSDCFIYKELEVTSLLHDCGKPYTQSISDDKIAHYYNHENVGSYDSLFYSKIDNTDNLLVAVLIRWHMLHHFFNNWKQSTVDKYKEMFTNDKGSKMYDILYWLEKLYEADKGAH